MSTKAVFRSNVTENQANTIRDRIMKVGIEIDYQEEQHGAALVLIMKCNLEDVHSVKDVLASVGVTPDDVD